MARELPIRNGRLTTDLDADGHRIKNLPSGETFEQEQADWNQSDSTKPDFIKNKPTIPAAVTNCPVAIAAGDAEALTEWGIYGGGGTIGALLAALAAAVAALKRDMGTVESVLDNVNNGTVQNGGSGT